MSEGFKFFIRALKLISQDREIKYLSLAPVFIFILILLVGLVGGVFYIDDLMNIFLADQMMQMNSSIRILIYVLGFLLFGFFYYVIAFVATSLVSIPFCSKISDKVIQNHTQLKIESTTLKEDIVSFFKMLKAGLVKALFLVAIGIMLFICSFIPVLAPLAFFTSIFILAFDSTDFVFERFNYGFRQRIAFLKKNLFAYLGLTLGLCLVVVIPFVQFLVLPLAVCGSTLLFANKMR